MQWTFNNNTAGAQFKKIRNTGEFYNGNESLPVLHWKPMNNSRDSENIAKANCRYHNMQSSTKQHFAQCLLPA
jgi:hypothetical protein